MICWALARREKKMNECYKKTALERFYECQGDEENDPLERLRFFCSLAMNGQDWIDVEPFFDDVQTMLVPNIQIEGRD